MSQKSQKSQKIQMSPGKQKTPQYYRVDITRYPTLSTDAEQELFASYRKRRTAEKRDKIVKQYLYWAAELACRYCGPRMSKPEAISAANYGLMLAIERFDPTAGKRFVTYSYFSIRKQVLLALRDSYVVNPQPGVSAARYEYILSGKTDEDLQKLRGKCRAVYESTCAPVAIAGPAATLPENDREELRDEEVMRDSIEQASLLESLRAALPSLPKELRTVVELKYFNGGKPLSFVEIGKRTKQSPDHVRWLHGRAMKTLKKLLRPVRKEL